MFEKKRGKRFLASVMALVMLLSLAPVGALATEGEGQPAENQAVMTQPAKDQQAVVDTKDTKDTNENTPTKPTGDSDSAEATKPEGDFDESFSYADADTSDNDNGIAAQNLSLNEPAQEQSITAEYWVTNSRVTANDETSMTINASDSRIESEAGASVESLAPGSGTQQDGNVAVFWQARVLPNGEQQTTVNDVDRTADGKKIQAVRYYDSSFWYQEDSTNQWTKFATERGNIQEQLVFYYLIKTDFEKNISVYVTDWPLMNENSIPGDAPSPHQVNYEVWELSSADAELASATKLGETVSTYYNKAFTISAIKVGMNENEQYYIQSITIDSTRGSYNAPSVDSSEAEFSLNLKTAGEDRNLSRNGVITIKIYVTAYKYELAYEKNGGTINDSSYPQAGYYLPGISITAPTNVTKTGYTFAGWYTDEACTDANKWNDGNMPSQKLTLYAKWEAKTYTVNYDLNYTDATNNPDAKTNVKWEDTNLLPDGSNPIRDSYSFAGWYTQATAGTEVKDATTYASIAGNDATPSVTLYAHWNQNSEPTTESTPVYVYFKIVDAAGNNIKDKSKINNDDLKKTVYNAEAGGATWATLGKIASDATLENGEKYTGTNATLETVGNEATNQLKGNDLYEKNTGIATTVLANIEWFQLKQWNGATDYVPSGTQAWHLDGKITGYTVTYNKGTTDSVDKMPVADEVVYYLSGSDYTVSDATPTRDGYVFTGWKSDNDNKVYDSESKMTMPAKNVVLTAQWEVDNWKDADETTDPTDADSENGGDGIPDRYQVKILYVSDQTKGTVSPLEMEIKTIKDANNNFVSKGTVMATGSTATVTDASLYEFVKWTKDTNEVGTNAQLENYRITDAEGGHTYTFTANFKDKKIDPPTSEKAQYTVKHYKWDTQKKDYAFDSEETINSTVGAEVTATAKKYDDGYILNEQKSKQTKSGTVLKGNTLTLKLYYDVDKIGEGENLDQPDGTIDRYQVTIIYKSSDESKGTVSTKKEVLTIKKADNEKILLEDAMIKGSKATDNGGRNYFSNWTDEVNNKTINDATLTADTIKTAIETAEGGETYTFTANFGYSGGGGSGGSSRPSTPTVTIPDNVPTGLNGTDHYAYIIGYGNNDVRPQNNITRAEVATIFFRLLTDETRTANMTKSNSYNDVKDGDWFCCAVSTLSKMGIIKGYEDGSFKPDQKITRAETMTLVNRVLNRLPETKDDLHKDMKTWVDNMDETAWYYLAVQEATNSHYFKNKTSTKFEQWTDLRDTRDWSELEK